MLPLWTSFLPNFPPFSPSFFLSFFLFYFWQFFFMNYFFFTNLHIKIYSNKDWRILLVFTCLQTTIHVLAGMLGSEVCEWNTPTPTLWQEHLHNSNLGMLNFSQGWGFLSSLVNRTKWTANICLSSISKNSSKG